ncbi:MAG: hypothetical protein RJA70_4424, partial [Pseudomonadota bacterium]
LWDGSANWKKVASRTDSAEDKADTRELDRFLSLVTHGTHEQFADFLANEVDIEAFSQFELLDVAFGGDQHDFRENHKYYFDPYRGRWEPVAWNFRGFQGDPHFNLVESPITLRLKLSPGYLTYRDRRLYQFLTTEGAPNEVESRGKAMMEKIAPDLLRDPHWSAYRMLPRVDAFHRRMMRPLSLEKAALVFESELTTYRHRHAQLVDALEANPLFVAYQAEPQAQTTPTPTPHEDNEALAYRYRVNVVVDGHGGARILAATVRLAAGCAAPIWQLFEAPLAESASGTRQNAAPLATHLTPVTSLVNTPHGRLLRPAELVPGAQLVLRSDPDPSRGDVRSALRPELYPYVLETSCALADLQLEADHLATGARIFSQEATHAQLETIHPRPAANAVPTLDAGTASVHPWQLRRTRPEVVTLGPGLIEVKETRVFGQHQSVRVAAGTTLRMAAGTSLIFQGPTQFAGERDAPIEVRSMDSEPWGGIAFQGQQTEGSTLEHVRISGGSSPTWRQASFGGMLNLQDTKNIRLTHVEAGDNSGDGDVIHAAYTEEISISDTLIHSAAADALDFEFASAELQRVTLRRIGDDAVDSMGSQVRVSDSQVFGCSGNGISAGEESRVSVRGSLIANCATGALAKNGSSVDLAGSVLFGTAIGVRAYSRTVRYAGKSELFADDVFVVASARPIERKDKKKDVLDRGIIHAGLPTPGSLSHLRDNVLRLPDWSSLAAHAAEFPAPQRVKTAPDPESTDTEIPDNREARP